MQLHPMLNFVVTNQKLMLSNRYKIKYDIIQGFSNLFPCIIFQPRAGKPVRDSCGGAVYRAGKEDSSATKGLASTGMVFATCRHSILWKAVNMDRGESYRHTHLLHDFALACGFRIVCYDVVCQYWPFACDLASKLPEFKSHVEQMRPFLSRWHGKTHSWQCQVKNLNVLPW